MSKRLKALERAWDDAAAALNAAGVVLQAAQSARAAAHDAAQKAEQELAECAYVLANRGREWVEAQ